MERMVVVCLRGILVSEYFCETPLSDGFLGTATFIDLQRLGPEEFRLSLELLVESEEVRRVFGRRRGLRVCNLKGDGDCRYVRGLGIVMERGGSNASKDRVRAVFEDFSVPVEQCEDTFL